MSYIPQLISNDTLNCLSNDFRPGRPSDNLTFRKYTLMSMSKFHRIKLATTLACNHTRRQPSNGPFYAFHLPLLLHLNRAAVSVEKFQERLPKTGGHHFLVANVSMATPSCNHATPEKCQQILTICEL